MALSGLNASVRRIDGRRDEKTGLQDRALRAAAVASDHAEEVDAGSRFPAEAFEALRREELLGVLIPAEYGGEGVAVSEMIEVCFILGRACSATAMIYAMHQMAAACLVQYGRGNLWQEGMLRRVARDQLLIASSTTEGVKGGDLRSSEAPIQYDGSKFSFERVASCISYGAQADCILTTARRSPDASATQQALLVLPKGNYTLEKQNTWDTLGMRGTCSAGFILRAEGVVDQILSEGFDRVNSRCMMPTAHLGWAAAWTGIAAGGLERARSFVLSAVRRSNGKSPPGASHLACATARLDTLRGRVLSSAARFESSLQNPASLDSIEFQMTMTLLKAEASELALAIALTAMRICGLSGYRNDTEFSVGRQLRDLLSAPIMISNDRILANMSSLSVLCETPESLGF